MAKKKTANKKAAKPDTTLQPQAESRDTDARESPPDAAPPATLPAEAASPAIQTPDPLPQSHSARYSRNPLCPSCKAYPVVCTYRDRERAFFRCRQCGHAWEVSRA